MDEPISSVEQYPAQYWHQFDDDRIQYDLCPRDCKLHERQHGACSVRGRIGNTMVLTTYGRSSGFRVDSIEKKPLNQFYPGSSVLSFGTAGCNLACKFCQNWDISKSRSFDKLADQASPEDIARYAGKHDCMSVAFTYNDPVIFTEYAMDVADACHERDIKTVAVTAGYIHAQPRCDLSAKMDAANVDLKAFTEEFYIKQTGSHLQPVLETLKYLKHETNMRLELTILLIPGLNDSAWEIGAMSDWIAEELGVDVPPHFSAFHPDYKLKEIPFTPTETLIQARKIALDTGLQYVYIGNVHNLEGDTTYCPTCGNVLIVRDWDEIKQYRLTHNGHCEDCNTAITGCFEQFAGQFDRQHIPVKIEATA